MSFPFRYVRVSSILELFPQRPLPGETNILIPASQPVRPTSPSGGPFAVRGREEPWRRELRGGVRSVAELGHLLGLSLEAEETAGFTLLVPRGFVARMRPGDPNDPLLRQVLPHPDEQVEVPGFGLDPVGDGASSLQPGVLQKYSGRVLLVVTGACAVHCRYCFRRNYPYATGAATPRAWEQAIDRIAEDASVEEVILSGGDPLTLDDALLKDLLMRLERIEHVRRIRLHTRLPVVLPSRVTGALVDLLAMVRSRVVVVHHANHAQELDDEVEDVAKRLQLAGCLQLNQAVLLRRVNDSTAAQRDLCERLLEIGILPYYLHQLDKVKGAAHFETPGEVGEEIVAQLRRELPGYMVPRFVREEAGAPHKVVLA